MANELSGKVALVTGAGRGIGKAIALAYAKAGATVFCVSRTRAEVAATVLEIEAASGQAYPFCADVSREDEVSALYGFCRERTESLDIVVANAGIFGDACRVEDMSFSDWEEILRSNLSSAFLTARGAIPLLRQSSGGKLIFVGSGLGHRGVSGRSAYASSKAGLWMFTQTLAEELAGEGISVNELIPGPVDTSIHPDTERERMREDIGTEWFKEPEDVVPMALFLATQPEYGPTAQSFSLMRRMG